MKSISEEIPLISKLKQFTYCRVNSALNTLNSAEIFQTASNIFTTSDILNTLIKRLT